MVGTLTGGQLIVYRTEDGRYILVFNARRANPPSIELAQKDVEWLIQALSS